MRLNFFAALVLALATSSISFSYTDTTKNDSIIPIENDYPETNEFKAALISAIFRTGHAESTQLLSDVLIGQTYETRTSILEDGISCITISTTKTAKSFQCSVRVGTDDMNDDDRGWSVIQSIDVEFLIYRSSGKYKFSKIEVKSIAG